MIADPRVFDDGWLPRRLQHRDQAVTQLSRLLKPALTDARAEDVLLHGPSGVGKTVLARHTLDRLQERAIVPYAHVRCLGKSTGGVLLRALEKLPVNANVHRGLSIDERTQLLANAVDGAAVLILDEADDLHETEVLDAVANAPGVSAIVIIHDRDEWLARVDEQHHRRFGGDHQIGLERYGVDELADILESRADHGLTNFGWDRDLLEHIADDVAGVARRGIQTLRASAEVAEERDHAGITDIDVVAGHERAREQIRESNLDSLPFHHQVLYELIRAEGSAGIDAGELHRRYDALAGQIYDDFQRPIGERARRNKLQKLRDYDLIETVDGGSALRHVATDSSLPSPVDALAEVDMAAEITPHS